MAENISHASHHRAEAGSNESFGFVFAVVFLGVGALPLIAGQSPLLWALGVAGLFALTALLRPQALKPLNMLWFKFGMLLHRIISPLVMGVIFFLVMTPMGLAMRTFSKDILKLNMDADAASYWIDRSPPGPTSDSLKNQF